MRYPPPRPPRFSCIFRFWIAATTITEPPPWSAGEYQAARIIQVALGIESDDVANYCFPKTWPTDREQRAHIIGEWLQTEARYLA